MNKWAKRSLAILIGAGLVFVAGWRVYEIKQEQADPKSKKKKGSGARVDLSCGRLDVWVGPPMHGPFPAPGRPGDCDP